MQYEKVGLSSQGFANHPEFNHTANSINGPHKERFRPRVNDLMAPIQESAADAQDEYEASKAR